MSQMAAAAIATSGATIKGGYLQDVASEAQEDDQATNVNTVGSGTNIMFTPVGLYSNGVYEPITNTNYGGASGTWASSNPLAVFVNQQGLAYAISAGTANITCTTPNGVKFSEWTMHVTPSS
jgi:Big-like domain-containing protein